MQSIHLKETESTQTYLKQNYSDLHQEILVSTSNQIGGHGRRGTQWKHLPDALAFSFTLKPNDTLTLTPLEVGCLLAKFFSPKLLVKWPNDLINDRKEKVGGIICQLVGDVIVVGVGINLFVDPAMDFDFPYPIGGIFPEKPNLKNDFYESLPQELYQFILENRLTPLQVQSEFSKFCSHQAQEVKITDQKREFTGKFVGITVHGEAILEKDGIETKVLTGSLRPN